jgi:DNA-binding HxlR family transcriptional regulator
MFCPPKAGIDGMSRRMLTLCLRGLEQDGLVKRTIYPVVPHGLTMRSTPRAVCRCEPVIALGTWAHNRIAEMTPPAFDQRAGVECAALSDD